MGCAACFTRENPAVVRIVLSGQSNTDLNLKVTKCAHQFLAKPCEPDTLINTVRQACMVRDMPTDKSLIERASKLQTLPSLPSLYREIIEVLQSTDPSISKVGEVISRELGMTAKILQLVNSAFFGLYTHVSSAGQAVNLLGLDTVKSPALAVQVFEQFDPKRVKGLSANRLWDHGLAVASMAKAIAMAESHDAGLGDRAFLSGLLHDIGKLILAMNSPGGYEAVNQVCESDDLSEGAAEQRVFDTTHATLGAYLTAIWGLQSDVVQAIAYHYNPGHASDSGFSVLTALHAADVLERHLDDTGDESRRLQLDLIYLKEAGLEDRVPYRLELCKKFSRREA